MAHLVYCKYFMEEIKINHQKPKSVKDYTSYLSVQATRRSFDFFYDYNPDKMNERDFSELCADSIKRGNLRSLRIDI
jgi:hypothetical protein